MSPVVTDYRGAITPTRTGLGHRGPITPTRTGLGRCRQSHKFYKGAEFVGLEYSCLPCHLGPISLWAVIRDMCNLKAAVAAPGIEVWRL